MTDPRTAAAQRAFADKLREIFQFDAADLDFGVYRILNLRRAELEHFLTVKLVAQVEQLLGGSGAAERQAAEAGLRAVEAQLRDLGVPDPRQVDKWKQAKARLDAASGGQTAGLAREVFNDLTTFFSRYYDEGDFMPLPRYKKGAYAIPYDGSEVALHWANKDQYYIKTTEMHTDYVVDLDVAIRQQDAYRGRRRLVFRLHAAEADRDNNKTSEKRRYLLRADAPVEVDGLTLTAWFEFKVPGGNISAKGASELAEAQILSSPAVNDEWRAVLKVPVGERTALGHQLARYMRKNTSDYFIHKDLGGFLRGELDHFIKAEVLHLDDIEDRDTAALDLALRKVKAIRSVGGKVIEWLHQVEEFQKKLYLKKKFVLRTDWLVVEATAGRELASKGSSGWTVVDGANGGIGGGGVAIRWSRAGTGPAPFGWVELVERARAGTRTVESILVHGDNFQVLKLLRASISDRVAAVYLDPPYNAKSSEIVYKNSFKHSAWLSMMRERLLVLRSYGVGAGLVCAIDEVENSRLDLLLGEVFSTRSRSCIAVQHNPSGQQGDNFSFTHEYAHFVYGPEGRKIAEQPREDPEEWDERNLRDVTGDDSLRTAGANCFYPIFVRDGKVVGFGDVCDADYHPPVNVLRADGVVEVYPIDPQGVERKWRFARQSVGTIAHELVAHVVRGRGVVDIKRIKKTFNYKSLWHGPKYSANNYGTQVLNHVVPNAPFSYPKSVYTVRDCLHAILNGRTEGLVLDFFGGSGTTAHSVQMLNRELHSSLGVVLAEMGEHFDSVLVPRFVRASLSRDWRDGRPLDGSVVPAVAKVQYLESYDDALDSVVLASDPALRDPATGELRVKGAAAEDYHLHYQLDLESRGSLLNLDRFRKPWSYTIKTRKDGRLVDTPVDLVETFNYLLGLRVSRYATFDLKDILFVEGKDPDGKKVLVIWRDCDGWDDHRLGAELTRVYNGFRDAEFAQVYVNGDLRLPNTTLKVLDIESTFQALMFDTEEG